MNPVLTGRRSATLTLARIPVLTGVGIPGQDWSGLLYVWLGSFQCVALNLAGDLADAAMTMCGHCVTLMR